MQRVTKRRWHLQTLCIIDPREHRKQHNDFKLPLRCAAYQPAIGRKAAIERPCQSRFAKAPPRRTACNEQSGRGHAGPGCNAGQADRRAIGGSIEMSCAACQAIENSRAINQVSA